MSAEKKYTEREKVMAQREAVHATVQNLACRDGFRYGPNWEGSDTLAARLFPLTVTRPRIGWVNGDNYQWRVVDGYLQARVAFSRPSAEWKRAKEFMPHWSDAAPLPERVKMWADLFANPTEEVEAES